MPEPVVLNLGCGTHTSPHCINIDWNLYLRLKRWRYGEHLARLVLRGERRARFREIDGPLLVHDLSKGIPLPDQSVDAVYHAHFLEHVPRDLVPGVLTEIRRVLRADGVHRIVVPDLEILVRRYLESLERRAPDHDGRVHDLLEQMVREEAWGSSQQPAWRRRIENLVLGDARRRGEVHRWGWDEQNLGTLLSEAGFRETKRVDPTTSLIPNWEIIDLDRGPDGSERKPDSLYLEALR